MIDLVIKDHLSTHKAAIMMGINTNTAKSIMKRFNTE